MKHLAPCGHVGEAIVGTFVLCRSGCDGPAKQCPKCSSSKIEPWTPWGTPSGSMRCLPCGAVWWPAKR